jgi:choline dehydrogenase-like flavoprotein
MKQALRSHYDAIVIGSGAGGSAATLRLAQAGKKVLLLERGTQLNPDSHIDPKRVGRYLYDVIGMEDSAAQFLGGQTKFYGAALYRMRESDFVATQHETGISPAWPFSYAEFEPYYTEAEALYKVHGDADSDPTEPPRSAPIPYPPLPHSPTVSKVVERLKNSGTVVSAIPRGLDYGEGGKCVLCSTCDGYYCQYEAKMDADTATIRPAMATGNVDLALGVNCLKILTSEAGDRATGVLIQVDDVTQTIAGDHILVGAGIPGTMTLLYESRTPAHPAGLGNSTGNLGRHLGGHSVGMMFPIIGLGTVPDNHCKTFSINTYYNGAEDWQYPLGVIQSVGQMPYWRSASLKMKLPAWLISKSSLTFFFMTEAIPTWQSGYEVTSEGISSKVEPKTSSGSYAMLRKKAFGDFGKAGYKVVSRDREPRFWHETGTAVIGNDPTSSVCDANCELHDVKKLYVVDASALPTAGAVNTCLTIVALALRAADSILGKSTNYQQEQ